MPDIRSTKFIIVVCLALWLIIVVRMMMNTKGPEDFVRTVSQSEIQAFAKQQLGALQRQSFAQDQELCAVVFEDSAGDLGITPLVTGKQSSCDIAYFDEPGMAPVANFHTHGAFDFNFDSEVPSILDMQSDISSGMDGYVSTPGGRLWRIDAEAQVAIQICGQGCLPADPDYQPCKDFAPAQTYTVPELAARFEYDVGNC